MELILGCVDGRQMIPRQVSKMYSLLPGLNCIDTKTERRIGITTDQETTENHIEKVIYDQGPEGHETVSQLWEP